VSLFLSKVLSLFIHPLSLGLLLLVAGGAIGYRWRNIGLAVVGAGLLVIWVPSTPIFSDWLQGTLESRYPPAPVEQAPSADAIVALGGSVGAPKPPRVYPDLNGASDRVWHAARLYRAGKAPLIIASGGTVPWKDQQFREAPVMQQLLDSWGVPPDSVLLESTSANTYENAVNTADLAKRRGIERILLVTSALHMRRALATFRSTGLTVVPAATDYQVVHGTTTLLDGLPSAGALSKSTAAIREYVGYVVYDWRGWIAGWRGQGQGDCMFKVSSSDGDLVASGRRYNAENEWEQGDLGSPGAWGHLHSAPSQRCEQPSSLRCDCRGRRGVSLTTEEAWLPVLVPLCLACACVSECCGSWGASRGRDLNREVGGEGRTAREND
jgi:uncharacterized SAM-binding protein YcdF (DUF218 family)